MSYDKVYGLSSVVIRAALADNVDIQVVHVCYDLVSRCIIVAV